MPRTLIVAAGLAIAGSTVLLATPAQSGSRDVTDRLVVREQCFAQTMDEVQMSGGGLRSGRGGGGGPTASAPGVGSTGGRKSRRKTPSSSGYGSAPAAAPAKEVEYDAAPAPRPEAPTMDDVEDLARPTDRPRTSGLDWGTTVYLSNDDSMSLASAQRVLYQAMNGRTPSFSEIRPHELLNYFSFDTVTPDPERRFDVLASGRTDGEKLTVALAVKGATPARRPLDLTLLVDRSGSMQADGRMEYVRRALLLLQDQLVEGDRIDLVVFDHTPCTPIENYVVGRDDANLLTRMFRRIQPEGSTDLNAGLQEAYRVAEEHRSSAHRNRRVMVLTDALLNTGDVNPATVTEVGRAFDRKDI
ncbi:MAG: VWA domain-containing protein, partial [Myxococcota bacterium]